MDMKGLTQDPRERPGGEWGLRGQAVQEVWTAACSAFTRLTTLNARKAKHLDPCCGYLEPLSSQASKASLPCWSPAPTSHETYL